MTEPGYEAVLTGDIIRSSRLSPAQMENVRASLAGAVDSARRWKRGLVKGKPAFFRGDGWQLLLSDPAAALRAGIFLRASLLAGGLADSRVAIGLGETGENPSRKVALSTGQAFVISGRALDEMTHYSRMTIQVPGSAAPLAGWMPVVAHLCDGLIRQWTRRQAEIVCLAIHPKEPGYEAIARSLRPAVSKQAVAKALTGAGWYVIREAIREFEQTPWGVLLRQPKTVVSARTTKKG